ncbi:hypothetical protein NPX13_g4090 [Xylaria arbuscula]|uniref:Carboxylic ester hydrolase n=1 Tax=Xylaria arbuscula TaxID=114810 RepID=A0A9W8TNZ0_9PEZI|nr:hypothetical protein NPX13_g4090 [Xylaria arbuscula]
MKVSRLLLSLASAPSVLADFWLVCQRRFVQIGRIEFSIYGISIVATAPQWTCEKDAFSHIIIPDMRDASGANNYGVEFEPWNAVAGPLWHDPLVSLKINMDYGTEGYKSEFYPNLNNGVGAIAEDKGFAMMSSNDGIGAQCYLNRTFVVDLDCWFTHPDPLVEQFNVNINGSSMFFCKSDVEADAVLHGRDGLLRERDDGMLPIGIPVVSPTMPPCLNGCDE